MNESLRSGTPMTLHQRILVVDDEQDICDILKFNLVSAGYDVDLAYSAEEAITLDLTKVDLILLDVMMGEMDGFEFTSVLKSNPQTSSVPIIFLTAKSDEEEKLRGLGLGADDYIVKPFSIKELIARIKVVLSRYKKENEVECVSFEKLSIDNLRHVVRLGEINLSLTPTEYHLLWLFLNNRGRVFSRKDLIKRVWPHNVIVTDRTVDVNIARLRKKLGIYGANIVAKLGFGYSFDEEI